MYVTIGLGISVSEYEIYITLELEMLENYNWPLPWNDPEEMGGIHPTYLNLSLNVSQKFTL